MTPMPPQGFENIDFALGFSCGVIPGFLVLIGLVAFVLWMARPKQTDDQDIE